MTEKEFEKLEEEAQNLDGGYRKLKRKFSRLEEIYEDYKEFIDPESGWHFFNRQLIDMNIELEQIKNEWKQKLTIIKYEKQKIYD